MNIYLAQLPTAIATIFAAVLVAVVSYVTITLNKEQKTSDFRQAWIDELREELAIFCSAARAFARSEGARVTPGAVPPFSDEKREEFRYTAAISVYKVQLRLNAKESEHIALLDLMKAALHKQNGMIETGAYSSSEVLAAIDAVADYAGPVLKAEWNRVKQGEPSFVRARDFAKTAIAISLSLLAVVIVMTILIAAYSALPKQASSSPAMAPAPKPATAASAGAS